MEIINSFKKYLMATVVPMVYKDSKMAELNETMESLKAGDLYTSAMLKADTFYSYQSYPAEVLRNAGIIDELEIPYMVEDKYLIPKAYWDRVVIANREYIIENFEETNDYYRMINGQPDVGQESIMIDWETAMKYGYNGENMDDLYELHKLPDSTLRYMESVGYLDELYEKYPEHNYIPYLGARKISIVTARRAEHFTLLYVPRLDNAYRFYRDFVFYYEESRQYFMSCIYNRNFADQYAYYSSYIGFMILHMTIQRMLSSLFKVMVDRDFYDLETVRVFLSNYSIPFVELFTMNQQKMLVKNLNVLLRQKSDVQVLYDILNLLGYSDFDLLKYILVKQHRLEQENDEALPKPVFYYRTTVDENGNPILELDRSSMYDYYFVGVDMNENDIVIENSLDANAHPYDEFVSGDSTWIQDDELVKKLEELEMNYLETKYADIAITFRMHQINFELTYLTRLILDGKNRTDYIRIDIPVITEAPASLFNLWILLICLLCKRNGMEPDIMESPSKILYILGFNFEANLTAIRMEIENNPDKYSQKLLNWIKMIEMTSTDDVNEMYRNIKQLSDFLIEAMQVTDDPDVYHAYRTLYNTLLYTEYNDQIYNMSNLETATRFDEYLLDAAPDLYDFLNGLESSDECIDYINYIATKMSGLLEDTEYLSHLNPIDTTLVEGILTILRAFKSFTIDIKGINIKYMFDSRLDNLIKMMDKAWIHINLKTYDNTFRFADAVHQMIEYMKYYDRDGIIFDKAIFRSNFNEKDFFHFVDKFVRMEYYMKTGDRSMAAQIGDSVRVTPTITVKEKSKPHDEYKLYWVDPGTEPVIE